MPRRPRRSGCPVNFALETFGDAWSLLVVRDLMFMGRSTYTQFLRSGEGIATNILASRLRRLERRGIIARRGSGRRAAYALTDKGLGLLPMMLEIIDWSMTHDRHSAGDRRFLARLRKDRVGLAAELGRGLRQTYELGSSKR